MKLFYSPGACSMAPHIIALELGLNIDTVKVDMQTKQTKLGDYLTVNPKGYVPALELENGEVLTEAGVVLQFLADQMPTKNLIPRPGSMERYRVQEWLNFITSEIHKNWSGLFNKTLSEEAKTYFRENLTKRYAYVNEKLHGKPFLMGSQFTIADAYLFVVTNWAGYLRFDLTGYPNVMGFMERVSIRPAVQATLQAEGLKK